MTDFDSSDETFLLSRRTMLGGAVLTGVALAGSGLLGAAPALGASLIREEGIPTDPVARIAMIRRMRLRTDPGIVYWWFRGRNYAQQGAKLTPLCELVFGAVMQVNPLADGSMELTSYELGFRTAPGLVADGRDMGSVVFPDATLKVFLTADRAVRAERRHKQLMEKGMCVKMPAVVEELQRRDERDSSRPVAPLRHYPDAQLLDTTHLSIDEAVQAILGWYRQGVRGQPGSP